MAVKSVERPNHEHLQIFMISTYYLIKFYSMFVTYNWGLIW